MTDLEKRVAELSAENKKLTERVTALENFLVSAGAQKDADGSLIVPQISRES